MLIETRLKRAAADLADLLREPSFDRKDTGHLQIAAMHVQRVLEDFNSPPRSAQDRVKGAGAR